jgi:hypothetical protein
MAPLVITGGVLIRLIWSKGGSDYAINVLGSMKTTATTIDQTFANTAGAAIKAASGTTGWLAQCHTTIALSKIGFRDISAAGRPEFLDAGAAVVGTSAGASCLPPQIAMCVTLRTAQVGKSVRGRVYLPGLTTSSVITDGSAAPAVVTASAAFVQGIDSALSGPGLQLAVLSRKLLIATDVSLVQTRNAVLDTIRKRATPGV